jgi:hypothetical protein
MHSRHGLWKCIDSALKLINHIAFSDSTVLFRSCRMRCDGNLGTHPCQVMASSSACDKVKYADILCFEHVKGLDKLVKIDSHGRWMYLHVVMIFMLDHYCTRRKTASSTAPHRMLAPKHTCI